MAIAGALGIALGNEWFDDDGFTRGLLGPGRNAFVVAALFPILASLLARLGLTGEGQQDAPDTEAFRIDWRNHFLSFGTAWSQGFLEGGLLAFLSLHLMSLGMSLTAVGALMGVTMIGVIVFQIPVSWLADRLGRTRTLLACYGVVLATLLSLPWISSLILLGCVLFLLGALFGGDVPPGSVAARQQGLGRKPVPRVRSLHDDGVHRQFDGRLPYGIRTRPLGRRRDVPCRRPGPGGGARDVDRSASARSLAGSP